MEKTILKQKWDSISKDEKWIMGRPNFTCAAIASLMRLIGMEVAHKAEDEQAVVIFAMLQFHKEHGDNWREQMSDFLAGITPISANKVPDTKSEKSDDDAKDSNLPCG